MGARCLGGRQAARRWVQVSGLQQHCKLSEHLRKIGCLSTKLQGRLAAEADAHARNVDDFERSLRDVCAQAGVQPADGAGPDSFRTAWQPSVLWHSHVRLCMAPCMAPCCVLALPSCRPVITASHQPCAGTSAHWTPSRRLSMHSSSHPPLPPAFNPSHPLLQARPRVRSTPSRRGSRMWHSS